MGLYANTVTTTWANLKTTLAALTANTSVIISDPNNVKFAPTTSSPSTGTSFGDIIYSATPSTVLVDFSDNDFSANTNVTNTPITTAVPFAGWFSYEGEGISDACRISGMGKLPTITTSLFFAFYGTNLQKIDLSNLSNVVNASFAFYGTKVTSIDISSMVSLTTAQNMLGSSTVATVNMEGCTELKEVAAMLSSCTSLAKVYMLNNTFNLSSEPSSTNQFMSAVPPSCVFYVTPSSYSTWYSRLYTNYSNWGLSAAKTPTTANLVVYHRVA